MTPRPLAQILTRRLAVMAGLVVLLNVGAVGLYYGTGRLEAEMVKHVVAEMTDALDGQTIPEGAAFRQMFEDHPDAYAFALVTRGGEVVQEVNPALIPPAAKTIFADDWVTRQDRQGAPLIVAGHEFTGRADGLRMVFVMADDPAGLHWRAFLTEFYFHVALPMLPAVILLIGVNAVLLRRGLAPLAAAATWARAIRPGAPVPPPPLAAMPAEVTDLVEATQRALDRLSVALEAESRHAAEAAHALRTPVAVLVARLDALPPGDTTERLRADLVSLSRMVQQVLASSRADMFDPAEGAVIDLREVAAGVTATMAPFAHAKGVSLALDTPAGPVLAQADAEGVELALTNLIENAILHGGRGQVDIAVGADAAITVRDHGPGLPPGAGQNILRPFWRGRDAVPGGAGLGLAIVERVQRAHGGRVEARPAEGGGALFRLVYRPAPV